MITKLRSLFKESLRNFIEIDRDNIEVMVNEVNLVGRLAIHMDRLLSKYELSEYFVDPEYNRMQEGNVKVIITEFEKVVRVNCDLLLHNRRASICNDNLIAIEFKKSTRSAQEKEDDKVRIKALTKSSYNGVWQSGDGTSPDYVCSYVIGYYVELNISNQDFQIEEYVDGELYDRWKIALNDCLPKQMKYVDKTN